MLGFFVVSFGVSWAIALWCWMTGGFDTPLRQFLFSAAFMWGPAFGAGFAARGKPWVEVKGLLGLGWNFNRALFWAWGVPLGLVVGSTLLAGAATNTGWRLPLEGVLALVPESDPDALATVSSPWMNVVLVIQAVIVGPLLNTPMMLSEELGWRGYLWERTSHLSFGRRALAIGAIWGVWHAPLIALGHNWPKLPFLGPWLMLAFCVLLAFPLHWIREWGGTVWHACVFHGTVNATASLGALMITTDDPVWSSGLTGAAGFTLLLGIVPLVFVLRRNTPAFTPGS